MLRELGDGSGIQDGHGETNNVIRTSLVSQRGLASNWIYGPVSHTGSSQDKNSQRERERERGGGAERKRGERETERERGSRRERNRQREEKERLRERDRREATERQKEGAEREGHCERKVVRERGRTERDDVDDDEADEDSDTLLLKDNDLSTERLVFKSVPDDNDSDFIYKAHTGTGSTEKSALLWCSWIQFPPFTGVLSLSFFIKNF